MVWVVMNLVTVQCKRISMAKIMELVRTNQPDILDQFNQYKVHYAWFDVSYGGCQFGIFSDACPLEPLQQSLENCIISNCLSILFKEEMCGLQKAKLNSIVRNSMQPPHQHFASMCTIPTCLTYSGKM
jgi:hypothetical protein